MNRIIFNAFAFKQDYSNSPQLGGKTGKNTIDIYMKNIFVSLKSAMLNNPDDTVAIVTNYDLPIFYDKLFKENNIRIYRIDFNSFVMPKNFTWSLAFFKLCALDYMVKYTTYDQFLMIDADTVTVKSFKALWEDSRHGIMLYDINHDYFHKDRQIIINDYFKLYGKEKNIVHYGGEFICGTRDVLISFILECHSVYNYIKNSEFNIDLSAGDETITSIAASNLNRIYDAGAYIFRFWTGRFYLCSTNYLSNPISIWHIPNEKQYGFLNIFNYLIKHNKLPSIKRMSKTFGFINASRPITFEYIFSRLTRMIK